MANMSAEIKTPSRVKKGWKALKSPFKKKSSTSMHGKSASDPGHVAAVPPMPKIGLNNSAPTNSFTANAPATQKGASEQGGLGMDLKHFWDSDESSDEEETNGNFTLGKNVWYREPSTGLEQAVKVVSFAETRMGLLYKVEHLLTGEFKKVFARDLTRRRAGSLGSEF